MFEERPGRTLKDLFDEQNALARGGNWRMSPAITVKVLRGALYNGPDHKSLGWCEPGQTIEVAAGPYADSLIADGFVEPVAEPEPEPLTIIDATDAARALAGEHGLDLATVQGTGSGGRITKGDVEKALADGNG